MAKKHNTEYGDYEIYKLRRVVTTMVETNMDAAGNLNLDIGVVGKRITPFTSQYRIGQFLIDKIPRGSWNDQRWMVNVPLIQNYRNIINISNILNLKLF